MKRLSRGGLAEVACAVTAAAGLLASVTVLTPSGAWTTQTNNAVVAQVGLWPVVDVLVGDVTEDSVSLSWSPSAGRSPAGYEVSYPGGTITTGDTMVVVGGLESGTEYVFSVRAFGGGDSTSAVSVIATTN